MRLAAFIRANTPQIICEWERFAHTLTPAAESMSPLALRDHIKEILDFISKDIEAAQTDDDQIKKSQGKKDRNINPSAAETHASLRHAGGFNMDQMVSEYRALRASVIQLWDRQLTEITRKDMQDLTRFNEAIDQALVESIAHYSKKLDHSRNLFLGILSHDLRSPLSTARMSAELALKIGAGQMNERQVMLISQITDCSDRAMDLVNYLLDLTQTRLGSGIPIIRTPMDMGFVSRQLVDEMRTIHPERTFNLKISGNTEGEWDKPRMGQIFSNLMGNAIHYGFTDSPVTITVTGRDTDVLLSVHNEGKPISPASLNKIFESLIRVEGSDNPAPSHHLGLGLYITKEIVEAHKGTINVTSSEKGGTEFIIRLPRSLHAAHPTKNKGHLALVAV
jgi:signal transduction histidine kinase